MCVDPGKPLQPGSQRLWSGQAGAAGPVAGLPGTPVWLGAGDSGGGIFQTRCLGILGGSKAQCCRPLPACRSGFLGRPLVSPARTPVSASPQGPQGPAGASGGAAVLCPHSGTFHTRARFPGHVRSGGRGGAASTGHRSLRPAGTWAPVPRPLREAGAGTGRPLPAWGSTHRGALTGSTHREHPRGAPSSSGASSVTSCLKVKEQGPGPRTERTVGSGASQHPGDSGTGTSSSQHHPCRPRSGGCHVGSCV